MAHRLHHVLQRTAIHAQRQGIPHQPGCADEHLLKALQHEGVEDWPAFLHDMTPPTQRTVGHGLTVGLQVAMLTPCKSVSSTASTPIRSRGRLWPVPVEEPEGKGQGRGATLQAPPQPPGYSLQPNSMPRSQTGVWMSCISSLPASSGPLPVRLALPVAIETARKPCP